MIERFQKKTFKSFMLGVDYITRKIFKILKPYPFEPGFIIAQTIAAAARTPRHWYY